MATPSLLDDDDVLGHYFNCGSARVYASGRQKHSRESEATIDPVGEELIGKAKTLYLFNQFSHVSWIREGLSPLVYKGTPETTDVETRPKTPHVHVSKEMTRFEDQLTGKTEGYGKLLVPLPPSMEQRAQCGLRGVPKKDPNKLRIIMDGRPGNILLARVRLSLIFFSLSTLLCVWCLLHSLGPVYMLSVDYRHFYYQLRMPIALQAFYVIVLGGIRYVPAALPMGMHNSCVIGQCHTWAPTLFRERGEKPLGVADGEVRGEYMIRMAWLYAEFVDAAETSTQTTRTKVGAIFVLLDGVFVLTNDPSLRDAWNQRLKRNEMKFHIVRKAPSVGDYPEAANPGTPIGFCGIEFCFGKGHRPISRHPVNLAACTVQECKSVLGVLGYDLRARGVSLLNAGDFRAITRRLGREVSNHAVASFSLEERKVLKDLDKIRQCNEYVSPVPMRDADIIVLAITDAQPRGTGYVVFTDSGDVAYWGPAIIPGDMMPVLGTQMEMEAEAVADLCMLLRQRHGSNKRIAAIVGIDADAVRNAVNKGDSKSDHIAEALRRIQNTGVVLRACRVPGELNCADGPSRRLPPQVERVAPSYAIVSRTAVEAGRRFLFRDN